MSAGDHTLRGFAGYGLKRAFIAVQADVNATLAPLGLRMVTFSALVVIRDNPGLRQSRLAEILSIERPNLVLILDELEAAELIERTRARDDRRAYELTVTLTGRRLCDRACAQVESHDDRMTKGLSEAERAALHAACRMIEANGRESHDAKHPKQKVPRP